MEWSFKCKNVNLYPHVVCILNHMFSNIHMLFVNIHMLSVY